MKPSRGVFTVSIDFELFWGTRDHRTLDDYGPRILGGRRATLALLELFTEFGVHATWAVVGLTCFGTAEEARRCAPSMLPEYSSRRLSPYPALERIGDGQKSPEYFFARDLVEKIRDTPGQELASHTFSHYYCLEPGQTLDAFTADLAAMRELGERELGVDLQSLVFPRNQFNESYLEACRAAGIRAFRGNPRSWAYARGAGDQPAPLRRAFRLADSYLNLTGHHGHRLESLRRSAPVDVPASRFLRPWSRRLRLLEPMRVRRICGDLTYCAERGLLYHLWWHPENFGADAEENVAFLRKVLTHFATLRSERGMESRSMAEVRTLLEPAVAGTPAPS